MVEGKRRRSYRRSGEIAESHKINVKGKSEKQY